MEQGNNAPDQGAAGYTEGNGIVIEQPATNSEVTPEQVAAFTTLDQLRAEARDTTDLAKRDELYKKIGQLAQHAVNGAAKPSWYLPTPDPRLSDHSEHDSMDNITAPLAQSITQSEQAQLVV